MDAVPLHAVRNLDRTHAGGRSETSTNSKKEFKEGHGGAENQTARSSSSVQGKGKSNGSCSTLSQVETIDGVPSTSAIEQVAAVIDEQKQQKEGGAKDPRETLLGKDETQNKEEKQNGEEKVGGQATGSSDGGRGVNDETKGRQTNILDSDDGEERHKAEGMQASISEVGKKKRDVKAKSDHANGGESKIKKEKGEGRQTDHLCGGDSEEKPRAEGEEKSEGGKQKKAVSPPISVVTPPPKQPKNLKVGG